jgi:hypothetical protein
MAGRDNVGKGESGRGQEMAAYLHGDLVPAAVEAPRWSPFSNVRCGGAESNRAAR